MKNSSKTLSLALSGPRPSEVAGAVTPSNEPRQMVARGPCLQKAGQRFDVGMQLCTGCVAHRRRVRVVRPCLDGCTTGGLRTRSIRSQSLPILGATTTAASLCCLLLFCKAGAFATTSLSFLPVFLVRRRRSSYAAFLGHHLSRYMCASMPRTRQAREEMGWLVMSAP